MPGQSGDADQDEGGYCHSQGNHWLPHCTEQDQEGRNDRNYSSGLVAHTPDDMFEEGRQSESKDLP